MTARTCANCAAVENEDDVRFCQSCGAPLPAAVITAPDWSQPAAVQPPPPPVAVQPPPPAVQPVAPAAVQPPPPPPPVQQPVAPPAPAVASEISINRRTASRVFLPPRLESEDEQSPIISRAWIGQGAKNAKKQLSGERKTAGDLPDWDPLPPGELVVVRGKKR